MDQNRADKAEEDPSSIADVNADPSPSAPDNALPRSSTSGGGTEQREPGDETQVARQDETSRMLQQPSQPSNHSAVAENSTPKESKVELKREIGLFSAVCLIVSVMIGSGIFISPSSVLEKTGSVGLCLVIWAICGGISYLGALSFGELGTVVGESGAEYAFFQASFGKLNSRFWGSLPGFSYVWLMVILVRPAEVAILVLTFAKYLTTPITDCAGINLSDVTTLWVNKMIALLGLGIITLINLRSVRLFVLLQNFLSVLKIIACLIVIFGGIFFLSIGHTENISKGFENTKTTVKDIVLALYSGLWAFDGWTSVTVVAEEIKNPERNIPMSISIGVPLITVLYFMMNVAYMTVLPIPEMVSSKAGVAIVYADKVLGSASIVISLAVVFSTFGCAMSVQFGVSRICYVAARNGHIMEVLSYIHFKRMTPAPAVLLQAILCAIFIISGSIVELIEFVSFLIWIFYGLAMVSLIMLRRKMPQARRPYKVPLVVPVCLALLAVYLALVPLFITPDPLFLIGVGFLLLGVLVYYIFIYRRFKPACTDKLSAFIQKVLRVIPPDPTKKKNASSMNGHSNNRNKKSTSPNKGTARGIKASENV